MASPKSALQSPRIAGLLLAITVATSASGSMADSLFTSPFLSFDTGSDPSSVAIGDLSGDGNPDLVTANYGTNTVSVLLGTGTGSFGAMTNFVTGSNPRSVAVGDVNADGWPDLVAANRTSNTVSVLLGTGAGSFGAKTDFTTGTGPHSVAIADVNGDGKPDLLTANSRANTVSVLLGDGAGAFAAKVDYWAGNYPYSVAIGDVNGDGNPDLVTANDGDPPLSIPSSVSVLLGSGTGTFGANTDFATGDNPWSIAIGDVDGDGNPDLVTANAGENTVSVLLGSGTGGFGVKIDFATGRWPTSAAIGDVNGDGEPDLVASNYNSSSVSVLLGTGTGTFGAKIDFATEGYPRWVAIGDVNGDGNPDLVTAHRYANSVSVLLHAQTTVSIEPTLTPPPRFELAVPHPNPFRARATLAFGIPRESPVQLEVYDVQGKRVATLQNGILPPGHHVRSWDGATASGLPARPGVFLVRLSAPGVEMVRKVLLIR